MVAETQLITGAASDILAESPVAYLILYVRDLDESRAFYERQLGLRLIEADEHSAKYDGGLVMLWLQRARDNGVPLTDRRDDASDVVFLVDDINAARQALEARGVVFVRRRTYEIGLVTDFYDPNGHRLMIYQPSPEALSWASGEKIRRVWRSCGKGGSDLIGPASGPAEDRADAEPPGLAGKPLIYLFMFVPHSDDAFTYYHDNLGLQVVERVHCCNPACPPDEMGVAKYDGGGMLLTTHHVHRSPVVDDFGKVYSPRAVDPDHTKGIAPVFLIEDVEDVVAKLAPAGVDFGQGVIRSHIGSIARFQAATGHTFFLYQPSSEALKWPSGAKIREIVMWWRAA